MTGQILQTIQYWDNTVFLWIQEMFSCKFLDLTMPVVSAFGNIGIVWILLAFFLIFHAKETRKWGVLLLLALALNVIFCNILLKPVIARARPFSILPVTPLIPRPLDFSFPSGHTSAAFTTVGILWNMDRQAGKAALAAALLMGFSRLYIGVHFPTDVLGGALVGLLASWDILFLANCKKK